MKHLFSTLALLLALMVALCGTVSAEAALAAEPQPVRQMETKRMSVYIQGSGLSYVDYPVYYEAGVPDLPYVDVTEWAYMMNQLFADDSAPIFSTEKVDDDILLLNWLPGETSVFMSFANQRFVYEDFDKFATFKSTTLDVLSTNGYNPKTDQNDLFGHMINLTTNRGGEAKVVDPKAYDVPMFYQDGKYLMPMHTVFAFFYCIENNMITLCNNQAIFIGGPNLLADEAQDPNTGETIYQKSDLCDLYYSTQATERSEQLAEFGLNELCMELDCFYGLKDAHQISSFSDMLFQTDLYPLLISPKAAVADAALQDLINIYMDDLHSSFKFKSYLTGFDTDLSPEMVGISTRSDSNVSRLYRSALGNYTKDGSLPPYEEIGDTAYVTFNSFTFRHNPPDYYQLDLNDPESITDTISLVLYAHHQITRENSPVKNVVLDLSLNGGGTADAAVYVIGWFLGEAPITNVDTFSGAQSARMYSVDTNLDHRFTDDDCLLYKYNLYCLTSPYSFSCGNLVPWAFKANGAVTLVGRTTGGGSCVVLPMSSAWGTIFQISGFKRLAFVKNGSFYDVDQGVQPDIVLTKLSSFYDREKLTSILNSAN